MKNRIDVIRDSIDGYLNGSIDFSKLEMDIKQSIGDCNPLIERFDYLFTHEPMMLEHAIEDNTGFFRLRKMLGEVKNDCELIDTVDKFIDL